MRKWAILPGGVPPQQRPLRPDQWRGGVLAARRRARREADGADGDGPRGVLPAIQELAGEAHQAAGAAEERGGGAGELGLAGSGAGAFAGTLRREPLVRGHAAWALGRIASGSASTAEVSAQV